MRRSPRHGRQALPYRLDVTDYETYGKVVADIAEKQGRIDVLVNNAAINPPSITILATRSRTGAAPSRSTSNPSSWDRSWLRRTWWEEAGPDHQRRFDSGIRFLGEVGSYNAAKGGIIASPSRWRWSSGPQHPGQCRRARFMRTPMSSSTASTRPKRLTSSNGM